LKREQFPREAIAVRAYQRAYVVPLIAPAGGTITVLRRDPDWPGWIWAKGEDAIEAWVPESWLSFSCNTGVFKKDYNSIELSFQAGEHLTLLVEESGWYWARNAAGDYGWVRADYL